MKEDPYDQDNTLDTSEPSGLTERYVRFSERWGPRILIVIFILIFLLIFNFDRMFIFIQPGENGVLYRRFMGTDLKYRYTEGLTIIMPWNRMIIYDVRDQQIAEQFGVLTKNGLMINIEVSIRFRPRKETLPLLHVTVGPDYAEKVVIPEIQGKLRYLLGQYTPDEIYRSQGLLVRRAVETTAPELEEKLIDLDDLLLTKIELPTQLKNAIEKKLVQEQAFLEYEFRLARERQEHYRKEIEAQGIQQFQTIIETNSGSSFANYLTHLGIEATLALATSPNAKIVVVGGGENGLPLILNTGSDLTQTTNPPIQNILTRTNLPNSQSVTNKQSSANNKKLSPTNTSNQLLESARLEDKTTQASQHFEHSQALRNLKDDPGPYQ